MIRRLALMTTLLLTPLPAAAEDPVLGVEWSLLAIDGRRAEAPATLIIGADGAIGGKAPCNRYFATSRAAFPALSVDAIGATRMACPALAQEAAYFEALQAMTSAELRAGHLVLTGADDRSMEFHRAGTGAGPECLTCP